MEKGVSWTLSKIANSTPSSQPFALPGMVHSTLQTILSSSRDPKKIAYMATNEGNPITYIQLLLTSFISIILHLCLSLSY